ncbi:uncharacterized protein LOC117120532 [Anneissia japonica]|uniref:uncharacterized protein LOC117120532 n=1 Tax=Anneissia japonica TaxID=1529436 RepID=UPI001425718C|nr:uncharacterized protein LOC117120532 [Anneissia japonica]
MSDILLPRALSELDSQMRSPEDLSRLKFILFDIVKTEENSALSYLDKLQNQEKITNNDVTIIYEILFLMKKNALWTRFKKTLIDGGFGGDLNLTYFVKTKSAHFTDFRLMMLGIAEILECSSSPTLNRLKLMYVVPGNVTCIWMTLLYLEDKMKVDKDHRESLLRFAGHLKSADCPKAQRTVNDYVSRAFKLVEDPVTDEDMSTHPELTMRKQRLSSAVLQVGVLTLQAKNKQVAIEKMKLNLDQSAKECEEFIKNTETELKKQTEVIISKQLESLDDQRLAKLEYLEGLESEVKTIFINIEELKNRLADDGSTNHETSTEAEFKLIKDHLRTLYPDSVGQFKSNPTNKSSNLDKVMAMSRLFVTDSPIDAEKCLINYNELNRKCFGIDEKVSLEVCLRSSQGNDVSEEHETAPVTISVESPTASNAAYEVRTSVSKNIHKFELKFDHPGLWTLKVYVCSKMIAEVISLIIVSDESMESRSIPVNTKYLGGHIFDVCYLPGGSTLLACNFTNTIFSCNMSGSGLNLEVFTTLNPSRKISSLCCPFEGHVYMTDNDGKELIWLADKENRKTFGKGDFKYGSLGGIAATTSESTVHVFVSNTDEHCVNHYKDHRLIRKIDISGISEAKNYRPWFLGINSQFQLYISNGIGDSIYICSVNDDYRYVEHSLCGHYAVCIDENDNIILGCKSGLCLYDKDFKFVRAIVKGSTFGLATHKGNLAVVCPGEIKIFGLSNVTVPTWEHNQ